MSPQGWHHTSRSTGAHYFDQARPLCQDSDPGVTVDDDASDRLIEAVCTDCTAVYKSRVLHAVRMAAGGRAVPGVYTAEQAAR